MIKNLGPLLKKIATRRILVIGDIMLDHYIWGDATRISPEAPVPVVDIARDTWTAGGAANVALNITSLGARCTLTGFVNEDEAGARLRHILSEHRIELLPTPGRGSTIVKTRVLVQRQQLCRLDRESPPSDYQLSAKNAEALLTAPIAAADAIILSDYAKGILNDALVAKVTTLARAAGKFIALDPKPKRKLKFRELDLITPNRRESYELAGLEPAPHKPYPAAEICRRIHRAHGTRHLVITLGEDGLLLSTDGQVTRTIPTAAREVFDVSGAGDTALASLVLALSAGASLDTAAHFANAAAGIVVGKLGTALVSAAELHAYAKTQGH